MAYQLDFAGQKVMVTGGSRGIGLCIGRAFAAAGARVAVVGQRQQTVDQAVQTLAQEGLGVTGLTADLTNASAAQTAVAQAAERLGGLDVVVNNAGVVVRKPSLELTEADWDYQHDLNLKGAFFLAQAAGAYMVPRRSGVILNTDSIGSALPLHLRVTYCSSKAGLMAITRGLAQEWAPYGVRVNAVAPGYTVTDMTREWLTGDDGRQTDFLRRIPMGRYGAPDDIVGAYLFLASPLAAYVTGQTLYVDGGWSTIS